METLHVINKETTDPQLTVFQRKTVLTDAQIKALPSQAIQIAPAPGAGKVLILHSYMLCFKSIAGYSGTDAYTIGNIGYFDGTDSTLFNSCYYVDGVFFTQPTKIYSYGSIAANIETNSYNRVKGVFTDRNIENKGLSIAVTNDFDFTGGDPANTLEVTVFYSIVDS